MKALKIAFIIVAITVSSAHAQTTLYGDYIKPPTDIQRGFYMGTGTGLVFFLGSSGAIQNPGYALSVFMGTDIGKYLSLEGRFTSSINKAIDIAPLNGGIYFFMGNGLLRGTLPIKRIFPFVDIGGGIVFTHPDFAQGLSKKWDMEFGFGAEYYTFQRHFSLILRNSYTYIPDEFPDAFILSLIMKYTF